MITGASAVDEFEFLSFFLLLRLLSSERHLCSHDSLSLSYQRALGALAILPSTVPLVAYNQVSLVRNSNEIRSFRGKAQRDVGRMNGRKKEDVLRNRESQRLRALLLNNSFFLIFPWCLPQSGYLCYTIYC